MLPMEIPGYRYDKDSNRYYRIEASPFFQPKPTFESHSLPTNETLPKRNPAKKAMRSLDARWLVERACNHVCLVRDDQATAPLTNLKPSPSNPQMIAGVHREVVWYKHGVGDHWQSISSGVYVPGEDDHAPSNVHELESIGDALLEWHPTKPLVMFAGGTEGAEYIQPILVGDLAEPVASHALSLNSSPTCGTFFGGGHKAMVFSTRKRMGCIVDFDSPGDHRLEIPKLDSDALSCCLLESPSSPAVMIGLRRGRVQLWDPRENIVTEAFNHDFGAPIMMLTRSSTREGLVFVHAPKGLTQDCSVLMDLRRPDRAISTFDLRARINSSLPSISTGDPSIGQLVFAQDARDHRVKVFELDTGKFLCSVGTGPFPAEIKSMAVMGPVESRLMMTASFRTQVMFCETRRSESD